ncbi:hypothetical protein IWQ60_006511 [Tieghemiomyces parasiticus]|uniref:Uncharacterized protein n=1 Tax=Tieghemiomyces parasiticus TaxID=78921 RepID=A0A9W8ACX3_9FUNG|nr:hypothetical protein IWQ60_006511 [Tieghemiomyces parasiticus]
MAKASSIPADLFEALLRGSRFTTRLGTPTVDRPDSTPGMSTCASWEAAAVLDADRDYIYAGENLDAYVVCELPTDWQTVVRNHGPRAGWCGEWDVVRRFLEALQLHLDIAGTHQAPPTLMPPPLPAGQTLSTYSLAPTHTPQSQSRLPMAEAAVSAKGSPPTAVAPISIPSVLAATEKAAATTNRLSFHNIGAYFGTSLRRTSSQPGPSHAHRTTLPPRVMAPVEVETEVTPGQVPSGHSVPTPPPLSSVERTAAWFTTTVDARHQPEDVQIIMDRPLRSSSSDPVLNALPPTAVFRVPLPLAQLPNGAMAGFPLVRVSLIAVGDPTRVRPHDRPCHHVGGRHRPAEVTESTDVRSLADLVSGLTVDAAHRTGTPAPSETLDLENDDDDWFPWPREAGRSELTRTAQCDPVEGPAAHIPSRSLTFSYPLRQALGSAYEIVWGGPPTQVYLVVELTNVERGNEAGRYGPYHITSVTGQSDLLVLTPLSAAVTATNTTAAETNSTGSPFPLCVPSGSARTLVFRLDRLIGSSGAGDGEAGAWEGPAVLEMTIEGRAELPSVSTTVTTSGLSHVRTEQVDLTPVLPWLLPTSCPSGPGQASSIRVPGSISTATAAYSDGSSDGDSHRRASSILSNPTVHPPPTKPATGRVRLDTLTSSSSNRSYLTSAGPSPQRNFYPVTPPGPRPIPADSPASSTTTTASLLPAPVPMDHTLSSARRPTMSMLPITRHTSLQDPRLMGDRRFQSAPHSKPLRPPPLHPSAVMATARKGGSRTAVVSVTVPRTIVRKGETLYIKVAVTSTVAARQTWTLLSDPSPSAAGDRTVDPPRPRRGL